MTLTHRICLAAALPAALLALGGCGAQAGGQTGEESGDGCVFATTPLSRQEPSPLGFSAEQALALAEGEQTVAFRWLETPGVAYGPESGAGQLTLQTSATGPAKFARVDAAKSRAHCEDHVRIPVRVGLATAGGALDESLTVPLIATTSDEASVTEVVPGAELDGAFAFAPDTLGRRRFVRLEVNLRFRPAGSAGYLLAGIESGAEASGAASFQPLPLACWGDIPLLAPACAD